MRDAVVEKLSKVHVSPFFVAILDCLLDRTRNTEPQFAAIMVSGDSFLGQQMGHIGFNDHLGSTSDLRRNLQGVAGAAGLTEEETTWLLAIV